MKNVAIFLVFVAFLYHKFFPSLQERMALVLVETKDQYNDSISQIPGLKVILEIVKNIDDFIFEDNMKEKIESRKKWNLALIFEDERNKKDFAKSLELELQQNDFIQDFEILPFTSRPLYASIIDGLITLKSRVCSISPSICGQKLTKFPFNDEKTMSTRDKRLVSECKDTIVNDSDHPLEMININKDNKLNDNNQEFAKTAMLNIFPQINARILMTGDLEPDYWDKFVLVRYPSKNVFCEMMMSEEYRKIQPLKISGLDDAFTSLAKRVA